MRTIQQQQMFVRTNESIYNTRGVRTNTMLSKIKIFDAMKCVTNLSHLVYTDRAFSSADLIQFQTVSMPMILRNSWPVCTSRPVSFLLVKCEWDFSHSTVIRLVLRKADDDRIRNIETKYNCNNNKMYLLPGPNMKGAKKSHSIDSYVKKCYLNG